MKTITALIALLLLCQPVLASPASLSGNALEVYQRAQGGRWFAAAAKLNPEILPTRDGQSFFAVWAAPGTQPKRWIVSLHGSNGFATDDIAIWQPQLKQRDVGLISLQWWIGSDDSIHAYYAPMQIYREIDLLLQQRGIAPGSVMLHGFSRGSANAYAVAALDGGRGRKYFSLAVASSGGVGLDYPPTRAILSGAFGDRPLRGSRWITVAGAHDANPERDGVAGMRRAAAWLREQGATVLESIEDPEQGHGALQRNARNAQRVLDLFLAE